MSRAGERQFDLFGGDTAGERPQIEKVAATTVPSSIYAVNRIEPEQSIAAQVDSVSPASRVIEDAGAELVYNRRNRVKSAKGWHDIADLNDALKAKEVVKANIWPKPDYKQLIADGMQPMVAHIVKQVYDSVAAKPVIGAREVLDDAAMQRYITALNRVEAGVMQWSHDAAALKQWAEANMRVAGAMLGQRISLSELAGEPKTLLDTVYPGGWKNYRTEFFISGGNKLMGALQPRYNEIRRAMKAIEKGWPEKREAWEIQGYRVVESPSISVEASRHKADSFILLVDEKYIGSSPTLAEAQGIAALIKPFVLFNKRSMVDSFNSEEEAVQAAKDRTKREKGTVIGEKGGKVEAVERIGVNRRMEGENISSERLMTEFGLKGVNFGNWMKTPSARAEAQLHLNHAFDSLHDLAEILGVPPRALSLNGMLGLAIGAQGGGGSHAAHFVPGVNEINLTRTSGAGSLAHEWAHALDHYFATQAGLATAAEPFMTEHASSNPLKSVREMVDGKVVSRDVPRFGDSRTEVVAAFSQIVKAMNERLQTPNEAKVAVDERLAKARKSVNNWLKAIRRDFGGQEEAFDVLAARVQAGDLGDGKVAMGRSAYIAPVVAEIRELYKEKHGRIYSIDNIKGLQAWVDNVGFQESRLAAETEHAPQKVLTDFAKNARQLDAEKGGKPYWSTTLEKFARAFDAFVSDELELRSAKNEYLSHAGRNGVTVPMGDEREVVNSAFRALVGEVKTRETEKGVALCSLNVGGPVEGLPVAVIEAEVARMRKGWPSMPGVTVVRSVDDLAVDVKRHSDGVHYDGHVYVVAENVGDLKQLQKVMAHECVLHHSLEEMLGEYGFAKLNSGIQALKKKGDPVIGELAADIHARYGVLPPEQETKEIVARAGERCLDETGNLKIGFGFMKSVFARVAGWLRDHGIKWPFSNMELQGIMRDAGKWIQRDREVAASGPKPVLRMDGVVLNSFAGVTAENAPLEKLRVAREMQASGVDDRVIWEETGWTFGFADGKPRFEIADDAMDVNIAKQFPDHVDYDEISTQLHGIPYGRLPFGENGSLGEKRIAVIDLAKARIDKAATRITGNVLHSTLMSHYPKIGELPASFFENESGHVSGSFSLSGIRADSPGNELKSTVLHELQHAIQSQEHFARGGSPSEFKEQDLTDKELSRVNQEVHQLYSQNQDFYRDAVKATKLQIAVINKYGSTDCDVDDPLVQEWWSAIDARDAHPESEAWFSLKSMEHLVARDRVVLSPEVQYRRLAGEVEARLTQARKDLSGNERAGIYPVDQMDVPVCDQTVRFGADVSRKGVSDGSYSGKILDVVDGIAIQKTGREGETVRHVLSRLSDPVAIGDVVDIRYKDGRGVVGGRGQVVER